MSAPILTPAELADLEAKHAAATKGRWFAYTRDEVGFPAHIDTDADGVIVECEGATGAPDAANCAAIASLHNAAPALFAAVRERDTLRDRAVAAERDAEITREHAGRLRLERDSAVTERNEARAQLAAVEAESKKYDTEGEHIDDTHVAVAVMRAQDSAIRELVRQRDELRKQEAK